MATAGGVAPPIAVLGSTTSTSGLRRSTGSIRTPRSPTAAGSTSLDRPMWSGRCSPTRCGGRRGHRTSATCAWTRRRHHAAGVRGVAVGRRRVAALQPAPTAPPARGLAVGGGALTACRRPLPLRTPGSTPAYRRRPGDGRPASRSRRSSRRCGRGRQSHLPERAVLQFSVRAPGDVNGHVRPSAITARIDHGTGRVAHARWHCLWRDCGAPPRGC
jgi:hypothetical protein